MILVSIKKKKEKKKSVISVDQLFFLVFEAAERKPQTLQTEEDSWEIKVVTQCRKMVFLAAAPTPVPVCVSVNLRSSPPHSCPRFTFQRGSAIILKVRLFISFQRSAD